MFNHKPPSHQTRLYVLFDGTHYNLLQQAGIFKFSPSDEQAYQGCLELAKECKSKDENIDPAVFSLVCGECSMPLVG
jgi:hypothetical protein